MYQNGQITFIIKRKSIFIHQNNHWLPTLSTPHSTKFFDFCQNIGVRAFHRCIYVIVVRKSIVSVNKPNYSYILVIIRWFTAVTGKQMNWSTPKNLNALNCFHFQTHLYECWRLLVSINAGNPKRVFNF